MFQNISSPFLVIVVFKRERIKTKETERMDVVALKKYQCPAACVSQWRQPSLCGDDTHAVVKRPKWAREHGRHAECGPVVSVGCKTGHSTCDRTMRRASMHVRPRHLAQRTGKEKDTRKERKKKERKKKRKKEKRKRKKKQKTENRKKEKKKKEKNKRKKRRKEKERKGMERKERLWCDDGWHLEGAALEYVICN